MARPKKVKDNEETGSEDLISDLIKDTQFEFIGKSKDDLIGKGSLTDKPKVKTPIYALNDFLGGGLPLGSMVEVYGPNAAGKSSIIYETLGNFQKEYDNGVAFIIDSEASTDDTRLKQLGVDVSRAPRMGASTLEDGFEQIVGILKKMTDDKRYKNFPVMIVWDTIAATPTRAQATTGEMYGGGMAERARIIKNSLTNIFPLIEKQNVLLILLNQVMAEIGGYRPSTTSAGGSALKHDVHLRLKVDGGKTEYDGVYATEKNSKVSIEKSKISPIINNIPIIIDITKGGVVDRGGSLLYWMTELTPSIFKQGAWWNVSEEYFQKYKPYWVKFPLTNGESSFRQKELYELARNDDNFVDLLQLIWLDCISDRYVLQKEVCKLMHDTIELRLMENLDISADEVYQEEDNADDIIETASELLHQTRNGDYIPKDNLGNTDVSILDIAYEDDKET